jgi:DNA-binding response OmpR family regulator
MVSALKQKILIVEDTQDILDYVAMVFRKAGFSVTTARNGTEGFEAVCLNKFDVVLTDIQMPNGNGLDLLTNIKKRNSETPVFLLTGDVSYLKSDGARLGAVAVLLKPILGKDLLRAVTSQLPVSAAS